MISYWVFLFEIKHAVNKAAFFFPTDKMSMIVVENERSARMKSTGMIAVKRLRLMSNQIHMKLIKQTLQHWNMIIENADQLFDPKRFPCRISEMYILA